MKLQKISILLFLICVIAFTGKIYAQQGYHIMLDLKGFKDNTKFYLFDLDLGKAVDSLLLNDGKGIFSGYVKEPVGCRIRTIDNKYLILELENCNISIKGSYQDFPNCTIKGSKLNDVWTKSRNFQRNTSEERDSLMKLFAGTPNLKPELRKKILARVNSIDSIHNQYRLSLIKHEKPSYFTIKELFYLRNDLPLDTLGTLFSLFPPTLQKTRCGEIIQTYLNKKPPVVGDKMIDIEGSDIYNRTHKLSDSKGKYVLLEFWASWCGPCVGEIPYLLKAYDAYKDKGFDIFSFSIDANVDSWKKASEKNKISWTNVTDAKGSYSIMAAKYAVRGIPLNYLINREGVIIAINLRGSQLSKKLDELLNK